VESVKAKTLRISNSLGLHARAAARIVDLVKRYEAKLYFRKDDQEVDGSSILSLLTLCCPKGTEVEVRAEGPGAQELISELESLFEQRFGEKE